MSKHASSYSINVRKDNIAKLARAVGGGVRRNSERVDLDSPRDAEDLGDVGLDLGLFGLPLVAYWNL